MNLNNALSAEGRADLRSVSDLTRTWLVVAIFALAMAWVESAVVYDLRTLVDRLEPYQPNPLPVVGGLGQVELVREAATMIMLLTVGVLAGRTWRSRLGYAALAFGIWDIAYYVFLRRMCGWPHSLADWDILFLLPLPWWGPVWAPVSIALLMILWGTAASHWAASREGGRFHRRSWAVNLVGVALALYTFMADSLRVAHQGTEVLRNVLPTGFNWPLFCLALVLMTAPIVQLVWYSSLRVSAVAEHPGGWTPGRARTSLPRGLENGSGAGRHNPEPSALLR